MYRHMPSADILARNLEPRTRLGTPTDDSDGFDQWDFCEEFVCLFVHAVILRQEFSPDLFCFFSFSNFDTNRKKALFSLPVLLLLGTLVELLLLLIRGNEPEFAGIDALSQRPLHGIQR